MLIRSQTQPTYTNAPTPHMYIIKDPHPGGKNQPLQIYSSGHLPSYSVSFSLSHFVHSYILSLPEQNNFALASIASPGSHSAPQNQLAMASPSLSSNFNSCPPANQLPEVGPNLPSIPLNITVGLVPARNDSHTPMVTCCAPNAVQLAQDCYYWCQLPTSSAVGIKTWESCIRMSNSTQGSGGISILGSHLATSGSVRAATGTKWTALFAVVICGLMFL